MKTFIRSIESNFRLEFPKPWRKFRKVDSVFSLSEENTLDKVPFLLVRFLLSPTTPSTLGRGRHSKENEHDQQKPVF